MPTVTKDVDLALFLAEAAWLRRLAGTLVSSDQADDLVQETWTQFAAHPPRHGDSPRSWLAQVTRNALRMRRRGDARRQAREQTAPVWPDAPDPEDLVARSQRLRMLARLVEALEEPFRAVVMLHYFEGLSLAEIARRTDTPSGTVRWRLKAGLSRLRDALDEEHGGDRTVWLSAFAPLGMVPKATAGAVGTGVAMSTVMKFIAVALVIGAGGIGVSTLADNEDRTTGETLQEHAKEAASSGERTQETAPPIVPTVARARPTLPPASASGRALFPTTEQRIDTVAKLEAARTTRLRAAGIDESVVKDAAADAKLLSDIEAMMMLEDASALAAACRQVMPEATQGMLYATLAIEGEPDIGAVVASVTVDDTRSDPELGAFGECMRQSLFMLSLAPPPSGGTQTLDLFFDVGADGVVAGQDDSED